MPKGIRGDLGDPEHQVFASAASLWEIAIKSSLGKVEGDVEEIIKESAATGFVELPVRMAHAAKLRGLPQLHRDPFDRLLIAQALHEGLTVVTADRIFDAYGVPTRWR